MLSQCKQNRYSLHIPEPRKNDDDNFKIETAGGNGKVKSKKYTIKIFQPLESKKSKVVRVKTNIYRGKEGYQL